MSMRNENSKANGGAVGTPDWWRDLSAGEKAVIRTLIEGMRGLKRGGELQVVEAARKWDRKITCFIKVQLMHDRRRPKPAKAEPRPGNSAKSGEGDSISSRASSRNQPGVSPTQG